jgi:hypothetical protein
MTWLRKCGNATVFEGLSYYRKFQAAWESFVESNIVLSRKIFGWFAGLLPINLWTGYHNPTFVRRRHPRQSLTGRTTSFRHFQRQENEIDSLIRKFDGIKIAQEPNNCAHSGFLLLVLLDAV